MLCPRLKKGRFPQPFVAIRRLRPDGHKAARRVNFSGLLSTKSRSGFRVRIRPGPPTSMIRNKWPTLLAARLLDAAHGSTNHPSGSGVIEIAQVTIREMTATTLKDGAARMVTAHNKEIQSLLRDAYDPESLQQIHDVLSVHKTLAMRPLPTGLFSASFVTDFSRGTNYHAAWTRDNVHVAYAHFVHGRPEVAVNTAKALAKFYRTQHARIEAIVRDPARKQDAMHRPHVRFNGDDGTELQQDWSHAQNDALGYFVWLYATLALKGALPVEEMDLRTLADFVRYFAPSSTGRTRTADTGKNRSRSRHRAWEWSWPACDKFVNSAERAKQRAASNAARQYRHRCVGRLPRLFPGPRSTIW